MNSIFKIIFFVLFYFLLIISISFADAFSDAINHEKQGDNDKALEIYYSILDKEPVNDKTLIDLLEKIISLEKSIIKINALADNNFSSIKNQKKQADFFKKAAEISELSGYVEKAAYYYEKAYSLNPAEENIPLLINASILSLETGDFDKGKYLAELAATRTSTNENRYKTELVFSIIDLNSSQYEKAAERLKNISGIKQLNDYLLVSVYKIAERYNLNDITEMTYKIITERFSDEVVKNILLYKNPVSPLLYLTAHSDNRSEDFYAYIQTGSFEKPENAEEMIKKLKNIGIDAIIKPAVFSGKSILKVLIPANTQNEAEYINIKLKENSIESFLVFN